MYSSLNDDFKNASSLNISMVFAKKIFEFLIYNEIDSSGPTYHYRWLGYK